MSDIDLDALRGELEDYAKPKKEVTRTPREERIIAGFEEIQRFAEEHGRAPQHGEDRDIFERIYAVRLDRLRALEEARVLLQELDHQDLLSVSETPVSDDDDTIDEDELLAELSGATGGLTELKHVQPYAERKAAEEIARRDKCTNFETFKPIFEQVQKELDTGIRETRPFELKAEIEKGRLFIVGGQKAYVAEKEEEFTNAQGRRDARMRVIFDNGTESNMLMRSLQRALNDDDAGRRITEATAGPLFTDQTVDGDEASGTIYVLRSNSDHPMVTENRDLVHKIGVTNIAVEKRIAGARLQPTFLMADVEIVATFELYNINRTKLENLLHRIFAPAKLEIEVHDRFGTPVVPREWFLVPIQAVRDAVEKIKDGTITRYRYDPQAAQLVDR
ncbi:GIY-YIG nuclease family protein [Kordiimonas sp.]|uniref:GIY-YIG nuclease family protein n=1 Tax=Kordiimonas sp. TaxID=1970157 RepID=UPI003A936146